MKIKNNSLEDALYIIMCVTSFGVFYFLRILITEGIKKSFEEN